MRKLSALFLVLAALSGTPLHAQDISGNWQGTLKIGPGMRAILNVVKADTGGWKATFYSIDQSTQGIPVTTITLQDSTLSFSIDLVHCRYEGKLSADGNTISGSWNQGQSLPLDFKRATKETAWTVDSSPHTIQFVSVDKDVKLEVLDWGGSRRPLVLLAGLGFDAHVFDKFAPKLTGTYHVYGITRRGFGSSSAPAPTNENYSADRLGDDVLAVIDALKLNRPVLAGHSIAGEELSSIGSRHPEKVAGLIYLDAGYPYAFYDRAHGDLILDAIELKRKLDLWFSGGVRNLQRFLPELQASLPQLSKDMEEAQKKLALAPPQPADAGNPSPIELAISAGEQKYTDIHTPVLAIFALPHNLDQMFPGDPAAKAAAVAYDLAINSAQANAFEAGIPGARVVRLANADHFIFNSNEADVLREMNDFLAMLP
jgi:pimeloyl-ACP methyl ester carboxylesterase